MTRNGRQQGKYWMFTVNNPEGQLTWDAAVVAYATWQKERGEQGTVHFQGYLELTSRRRLGFLRGLVPRAHWEIRRGTAEEAKAYCNKEESRVDGPWEFGSMVSGQGRRSDLVAVQEELDQGIPLCKIYRDHFESCARYSRFFKEYLVCTAVPRSTPPEVTVIVGAPGLGKTKEAFESGPVDQQYWKPPRCEWWDGYYCQPICVIDEFYGWLPVDTVLRLLDRYPMPVPVKHGFLPFNSPRIIITSNRPPWEWWTVAYDRDALWRRINKVVYYSGVPGEVVRQEFSSVREFHTLSILMDWFK